MTSGRWTRRAFLRAAGATSVAGGLLAGRAPPAAAPPPRFVRAFGREGSGRGEFRSPIGIAIGGADELFVTDLHNARVQRLGADGTWLGEFPLPRDMPSRGEPGASAGGIAIGPDGLVHVSLMASHRVLVFTADGERLRAWGSRGAGPGQLDEPGGIAVDRDGVVYVADQRNRRVQRFSREGGFIAACGGYGREPGRFDGIEPMDSRFGGPHDVALDGGGHMFTTEGALGRVQRWTVGGDHVAAWGSKAEAPGGFGGLETPFSKHTFGPVGVCADRDGRVWVSSIGGRVQLFTASGQYVTGLETRGRGQGEFITPHGMAMDSRGHLYVVDSGNQRVQVLGP